MATGEVKMQKEISPANFEAKEKYRRERAVVRRLFTTAYNSLVNTLQTGGCAEYYLRAELAKLTSYKNRLESLNNEIKNIILEDPKFKEEELLKEEEEVMKYLSNYFHMWEKCEALFSSQKSPTQKGEDPTQGQSKLKLPPIHIKKFDGNLKNWLLFYDQFKKINDNENIPDEDKYHYLLDAMADNSEVKTLVESYQSNNYADCLQHLKSRYAREELLIQVYVRELLALILGKSELSLTALYDKLSAQLRPLASLGVTKDKYAAFILPMIESALPEETLRAWERSTAHNSEMDVELNSLLDFIKKEVDSNQRILMAQSTFNSQETLNRDEQFKASASCLVYTEKKKAVGKKINYYNACIWCGKDTHASLECYKMNKMSIEQRIEHLKEKRACTLCLKVGHHVRVCKEFIKCLICGKRHSTAICSAEPARPKTNQEPLKNNEEEKKDANGTPSTTLSSQAMSQGVTLLQTVVVNITSGNKKIPVRAMFDNGSQRTYIKQEVVDKLKIPIMNKETLAHCLFGGMEINPMKHNVYQFEIESLDSKFKLQVEALSQKCICNNVPKINCSDLNLRKVLEQNQIDLADKGDKTDIELLIGADFSGYFMTGKVVQLQNGLVAIKTKVGWSLQGKQVSVVMNNTLSTTLFCSNNNNISEYWSLETLGIRDPVEVKSRVETEAEVIMSFEKTIQVNAEGKYEVQFGQYNWADLASRGCNAKTLLDCGWWAGPDWLLLPPERWPKSKLTVDEKEVHLELKKTVCSTNIITEWNILQKLQEYFSKYTKLVRSIAWMLRFGYNTRNKIHKKGELTYGEYEKAEKTMIKIIQNEESQFIQDNLAQFVDENNLVRIQTKLLLSDFPECTKTPYLLTAKHPVVAMMVRQRHTQLQHAGANQLIADVRARFWIVGIRRLVKTVISHCIICKRHKARKMQAPTAPLPPQRTNCEALFNTTGVDLAGPLYLRNGEKCWVVLYTCAVYRAVHLELTRSLSTEAFMMTLRRFIARRERINMMMSDQGTNFVGTRNLLTDLDWNEVLRVSTIQRITWKLNVPAAPWWEGYWERLINIMKELLRRILGKKLVTYDELQTLLCECESIMNNRPLTYVQDDKAETLEPLTPACFLQPLSSSETTDLDQIDGKSLNIRMRYLQKLRHDFRERFKKEYLTALVQKHYGKDKKDVVRIGQVVLLETEEKRVNWPLGIVTKIFTGSDGVQRSMEIKTSTGLKIRPIQRLYPLEVCDRLRDFPSCCPGKEADAEVINPAATLPSPEPSIMDNPRDKATATRSGRIINLPSRYKV